MSELSMSAMNQVSSMDPSSLQTIANNKNLTASEKAEITGKLFEGQLLRPVIESAMKPTFQEALGGSAGSSTCQKLATDLLVDSMSQGESLGLSSLLELEIKGKLN